jgi:hypothetical protein
MWTTVKTIEDEWKEIKPKGKQKEPNSQAYMDNRENAAADVEKYWMRFLIAESAVSKIHDKWTEIDKFDRGEQWKDLNIPPWVPKPVTNYIRYVRTMKRASLASGIAQPNFTPLHEDDVEIVRLLQLANNHVWEDIHVDRLVRHCIDRALLQGTAIAYIYTDDNVIAGKYYKEKDPRNQLYQGDIRVKRWPVENFFPDPDAYRLEDCKWIDTTEIVALRNVQNNPAFIKYCKEQGTFDKLMNLPINELEYDDDASGTIYERDWTPMETPKMLPGDYVVTLHTHWERYYYEGKWHLRVTYWMRNTDFFLLRLEDVEPNCYPFAVLYDEKEENTFWGLGTAHDIMENQKIVNKLQQTASILGVLHQNPQKVVLRDSGINPQEMARTGTLPGKVWQSNIPNPVETINPLPIPPELFTLDDRVQTNLREMSGINEAYSGASSGSLTTSTGVSDLIERATMRDRDKMIQIDDFVEQICHLVVLQVLYRWRTKRTIVTTAPNGMPKYDTWTPVEKLTAQNIGWRIRSDVYAKAPTTQAQRRQQAQQLLTTQGQFQFNPPVITPEEFVKMNEFQDQEEILQRMERDRQQLEQQKAQNLEQQIVHVAEAIQNAKGRGMSQDEVQQMAMQMAQQLIGQEQQQDEKNGIGNGSQPQATPQPPRGVTGQVQMANMAKGM